MAIVRCPEGHYFDDALTPACPHCAQAGNAGVNGWGGGNAAPAQPYGAPAYGAGNGEERTVGYDEPLGGGFNGDDGRTVSYSSAQEDEKTQAYAYEMQKESLQEHAASVQPVTGWLVCTDGPERGRDYRLHVENNFVGRDPGMDVVIRDDPQISRERHFSVVFVPRSASFHLVPGESSGVTLNGESIYDPALLQDGDSIGAGGSTFVLVCFCREGRSWS